MIGHRQRAYLLLETTIATGLLIAGLAVIGAQVQQADKSVREMELRLRALMLTEAMLAELDMGLVELDSVDPVQEEDFGPRYPDFGWRLTTEETAIEDLYQLKFDVLYLRSDEEYQADSFDHDNATLLHTVYVLRAVPHELDLGEELGLDEEEFIELENKMTQIGIPGVDAGAFNLASLPLLPLEEFIAVLPLVADAFGIDLTQMLGRLPPDIVDLIERSGVLGDEGEEGEGAEGDTGQDEGS